MACPKVHVRIPRQRRPVDVADRYVDIVEVRPPWDGVGEHTLFPIARLRYNEGTGQRAIYWRDRRLKFREYERKRPTKAYLAIIAEAVPDPLMFALLLDCVPGVAPEDRQPEPSPLA